MMYGLSDNTIEKINSVFAKYPEVEEVVLYGSRAKGNYRNGSDIDIAMKGENLKGLDIKIWLELDELLLPYMIDLSVYDKIRSSELVAHIDRIGKIFYKKNTQ